ncbi:MAG: hypothetical protein KDC46_12650, partial [Thermoleophilia bacterium]|nr:hypothetical protein [Thermoleophilia bacterium]
NCNDDGAGFDNPTGGSCRRPVESIGFGDHATTAGNADHAARLLARAAGSSSRGAAEVESRQRELSTQARAHLAAARRSG